jgi:hypothetical protein
MVERRLERAEEASGPSWLHLCHVRYALLSLIRCSLVSAVSPVGFTHVCYPTARRQRLRIGWPTFQWATRTARRHPHISLVQWATRTARRHPHISLVDSVPLMAHITDMTSPAAFVGSTCNPSTGDVFTAGDEGVVKVWRMEAGTPRCTQSFGVPGEVYALCVDPHSGDLVVACPSFVLFLLSSR